MLGYLIVENAIAPDYLDHLNRRLDVLEEKAPLELVEQAKEKLTRGLAIGFFNLLYEESTPYLLASFSVKCDRTSLQT